MMINWSDSSADCPEEEIRNGLAATNNFYRNENRSTLIAFCFVSVLPFVWVLIYF